METRNRNRLMLGAAIVSTLFLVCVIFAALIALAASQVSMTEDIHNLSATLAAKGSSAPQGPPLLQTGHADLRGPRLDSNLKRSL
jgi:hypothetical protein